MSKDDTNHFERLLDKMDLLVDSVADLRVIVAKQEENIRYHIKRTDLLEQQVEISKKEFLENIKPIQKHVVYVETFLKIMGGLAVLVGIFESVKNIIS